MTKKARRVKVLTTLKAGDAIFLAGKEFTDPKIPAVILSEVAAGANTVRVLEWVEPKPAETEIVKSRPLAAVAEEPAPEAKLEYKPKPVKSSTVKK